MGVGFAMAKCPQPLVIRITHWINVPALVVMMMSGLQILLAYPYFGPTGEMYTWMPLQGWSSPSWARAGHWLAGARHLHFAMAWLLGINGLVYITYLLVTREYKRRWFWPPRDTRQAWRQQLYYAKAGLRAITRRGRRPIPPRAGFYNGLQRAAYTAALVFALLEVWSGFAIWKPVQLHPLAWVMGGYDGARVIHFLAMLGLVGFIAGHLVMVAIHWRQFPEMITGGKPRA